ncbi:hypothetical protein SNE40_013762 [Patella caerulea]
MSSNSNGEISSVFASAMNTLYRDDNNDVPSTSTPINPPKKEHKTTNSSHPIERQLQIMTSTLETINKRLSKLDIIENKLTNVVKEISSVKLEVSANSEKIRSMEHKLNLVETSIEFQSVTTDQLIAEKSDTSERLREMEKLSILLKQEVVDLKCRSMRDNLLFFGITEKNDENCIDIIHDFIVEHLQISDSRERIKIDRAHRIGKPISQHGDSVPNVRPRPIVVKFNYYQDRKEIKSKSKLLTDSNFGISEQLPRDIVMKRKMLMPTFKKEKERGHKVYFIKDKLFINDIEYRDCGVSQQ